MQFSSAALTHVLQSENEALKLFVTLLHKEQQSLAHGKFDELTAFTESKSTCMFEMCRLDEQRQQWLGENSLTLDRGGMERLLHQYAKAAPQALEAWQNLLNLAQTAQQLNDLNGSLINNRLHNTKHALRVLFSAGDISGAYTSDGSTVCFPTAQKLAVV